MKIGKSAYLLLFYFALTSCSKSLRKAESNDILSTPPLTSSYETALATHHFQSGNWPDEKWWTLFASKELNDLIDTALLDNPSLQAIKQRVDFAKQEAVITRSRLFPFLSFDANEGWQYLSKNSIPYLFNPSLGFTPNVVDLSFSFNYEFDFWGKNLNLYRSSLSQAQSEKAESSQVELIVTTALAQTYFALKMNLERKKLYDRLLLIQENLFFLQKLLEENALISFLPAPLSAEHIQEVKKHLFSLNEEIAANVHAINALIGKGPDHPLDINEPLSSFPIALSIPENLSLDLLSRRPDLMAAIWNVNARAHDVGAAFADFYPDINLKALLGLSSIGFDHLFRSRSETGGLFPAIHLPIFTAGAIRANVNAKRARFNQAVFDYNTLLLKSTQEVADLLVIVDALYNKRESQRKIVEAANFRFHLTELNFESGLDNLLEVYRFETALIEKSLEDIELMYFQYVASIKLIKSLGGGYIAK
ncbi:MAG: efflux transporter outer membrane subunit [Simkaniaceae bacterium]|nr:efflux transporter outer membrane subunit [Simkaniaceae bacterium]